MSEVRTKPLDLMLAGISTQGVPVSITRSEQGLKESAKRADAFEGSAKPIAERDSRKAR